MRYESANLQSALARLYELVSHAENYEDLAAKRDEVRLLVHELNAAYLDWAFEIDNAEIKRVS